MIIKAISENYTTCFKKNKEFYKNWMKCFRNELQRNSFHAPSGVFYAQRAFHDGTAVI